MTGKRGIKGDKGDTGDKGKKGESGLRGPRGFDGLRGDKGDKGDNSQLTMGVFERKSVGCRSHTKSFDVTTFYKCEDGKPLIGSCGPEAVDRRYAAGRLVCKYEFKSAHRCLNTGDLRSELLCLRK